MTEPDHTALYRAIGKLEGKVDQLLLDSKERSTRHVDLSLRVKSLEKSKNIQYGRETALALALAVIGWPTLKSWFGM